MKIRDLTHFVWGMAYLFSIWFWFLSGPENQDIISIPMILVILLTGATLIVTSIMLLLSIIGIIHDSWDD